MSIDIVVPVQQTATAQQEGQWPFGRITILVPSHNEGTKYITKQKKIAYKENGRTKKRVVEYEVAIGSQLMETLESLRAQTIHIDEIVVIADNCSDDTVKIAQEQGVTVFETVNNTRKKAGGLNQWLDANLPYLWDDDLVMVMDADSALNPDFIVYALKYLTMGYSACGGVFQGKSGGGLVGMFQRNEYARYARDVKRKRGKTLVLTGTATVFLATCLKHVVEGRKASKIPGGSAEEAHVYDTEVLTEDNELTFALLHLGHKIIAPAECGLKTEVMEKWRSLWRQRKRWKRGAIENNFQYGFTKITAKYWGLQAWGLFGILATITYLTTLTISVITQSVHFQHLWLAITGIYVVERLVTVRSRGWKQMFLSAILIVEMPYDLLLQAVHVQSYAAVVFRTKKNW